MKLIIYSSLILLIASSTVYGSQDSILLTKNFEFKDGVYFSFNAFQKDIPDLIWDQVQANLVTNPQTYMAQLEFLKTKNGKEISMDSIWGITIGGMPYIKLPRGTVKKSLTAFAAIRVRGKICYFDYEDYDEVTIPMPVYNPITGKPYRVANVQRNIPVFYEKLLDFSSGEIVDLTIENLRYWVRDDQQLVKALDNLTEDEIDEKLFKCILIYDDRKPVYIKK